MEVVNSLHFLFPEFLAKLHDKVFLESKVPFYGKRDLPFEDEHFQRLIVLLEITLDLYRQQTPIVSSGYVQLQFSQCMVLYIL